MKPINNTPSKTILSSDFRQLLVLVAVVLLVILFFRSVNTSEPDTADLPTFTAKRGPLTINVTESGTIRPREQIILKNEVEGQTVILFIIEEGKEVKKGDLLVELDASELLEKQVNQQIQVINAEASLVGSRENLEVVKSQAQADIDQAALDLEFARQDLNQYLQGEFPKQEKEATAKITLAEETLTNNANTYEWSKKLLEEKYLSETELKRDELAWQKARLDLDLAMDALDLLQNFTFKRRKAELESDLKQKDMALNRVRRKSAADVARAEATLKADQAKHQQQKDKLDKIELQITKTKIHAPMDGTVIYATSTKFSWRGSEEPLDEGQVVRERQELIYLPTTSAYNVEIKVHESSLKKIAPGLPVRITIDALPGKLYSGEITTIAPLPDATSAFLNPDLKVYSTEIEIDGNGEELRNGMSCRAEIIVEQFDNALFVPVQAVILIGPQPTVFVMQDNDAVVRPVKIGLDNNRMVRIIEGIEENDQVLLTPPLEQGALTETAGETQQHNRKNKSMTVISAPQQQTIPGVDAHKTSSSEEGNFKTFSKEGAR